MDCITPASAESWQRQKARPDPVSVSVQGKETQSYYDKNGKRLWETQTGCSGDDQCSVYRVPGATAMAHTHVYHNGENPKVGPVNLRAAALSRNMPGPGDAAPLQIYSESLIKGPGGETFSIKGTPEHPTVQYLGGGDKRWGEYVQRVWKPRQDREFYIDKATEYLREHPIYEGSP